MRFRAEALRFWIRLIYATTTVWFAALSVCPHAFGADNPPSSLDNEVSERDLGQGDETITGNIVVQAQRSVRSHPKARNRKSQEQQCPSGRPSALPSTEYYVPARFLSTAITL
jgi:hypothetical protein